MCKAQKELKYKSIKTNAHIYPDDFRKPTNTEAHTHTHIPRLPFG